VKPQGEKRLTPDRPDTPKGWCDTGKQQGKKQRMICDAETDRDYMTAP
jgi:hypothetical protein